MWEQAVQASEATRQAAQRSNVALIPALSGCPDCGTTQMIAAPALSTCEDCGRGLTVLAAVDRPRAIGQAPLPRAA
jgi:uncharacterized protein (DUF983 family)